MNKKVSLSIGYYQYKYGDRKALELAKEFGLDGVDFDLTGYMYDVSNPESIYSKSEAEIIKYFKEIKDYATELGVDISQTHGRMTTYKGEEDFDKNVFINAEKDCLATKVLGAPVTVMHNISTLFTGKEASGEFMHQKGTEIFSTILGYAKKHGIILATETFGFVSKRDCCDFFGNSKEFADFYNNLKSKDDNENYFKVCIDTGHTNTATRFDNNLSAGDIIRLMGKDVISLHLNDNDTFSDQHKMPLTGTINWEDVLNALDEIGYDGYYNMELNLRNLGETMAVEHGRFATMLLKDMLKNHYEK